MLNQVNQKTIEIAKLLGYKPIKGLDSGRPYVLLVEKDGKKFVIKTDHFEDEVDLLKILNSNDYFAKNGIIIPNLYEHSEKYLIQDFIAGRELDILAKDFSEDVKLISNKINLIHQGLNKKGLATYTKGWNDQYSKEPFENSVWLKKRIDRWLSDKQSQSKYRFSKKETVEVINLIEKIQGKTIINYGAFSPAHIRIIGSKIGIFDFGRHLRWAPVHYDQAYLWWGLLFEKEIKNSDPKFWFSLAQKFSQNIAEKELFWACIIERLAGLSKDLTVSKRNQIPGWHKTTLEIRNKLTPPVINQLRNSLVH